jgi:hypothetical protein
MKLYHKNDVFEFLKEKYQTSSLDIINEHIEEIKRAKKEKQQKRLLNSLARKQNRKEILIKALNEHGLTLRSDSKLCQEFIDGNIKQNRLDWVVERMCQMKFLFEYFDMKKEIEKAKEEQDDEFNSGYIPDISPFEQAEMNILQRINGYPKVFPWLENKS